MISTRSRFLAAAVILSALLVMAGCIGGPGGSKREGESRPTRQEGARESSEPEETSRDRSPETGEPPAGTRNADRIAVAESLGWGEVASGSPESGRIALTLDAGAGAEHVPAVLDALKSAGVRSTIFLTGQFAESFPELVERMVEEGHELANHSYSHPRFTTLSAEGVKSQVSRAEDAVYGLTGLSTVPYFRFPYGNRNGSLIGQVNDLGYLSVFWTVDSLDWMDGETAESVRSRVAKAGPGAIVLMHCNGAPTAAALPLVIGDMRAAGHRVGTLTELLLAR